MKKRYFISVRYAVVFCLAGICLMLAACGRGEDGSQIPKVSGTESEYVSEGREVVRIGTVIGGYELTAAVTAFNESNDSYWAEIIYYGQQSGTNYSFSSSTPEGQAAVNRIQIAMTTGTDCPDLMVVNSAYMNVQAMAEQGYWEDLNAYLEKSDELSAEDFLEGIPEAYTFSGKLVTLPRYFTLELLVGRESQLNQLESWTAQDLFAYAEQYQESILVECYDIPAYTLLMYGEVLRLYEQPPFVVEEEGRKIVDRKLLASFLEKIKEDSEQTLEEMNGSTEHSGEENVLLTRFYISDLWDMQFCRSLFAGDVVFAGYPSEDGQNVKLGTIEEALYGIPCYAGNKEGAWVFLEFYLSRPMDMEGTLPARKDAFEEAIQRDMLHEGYEVNEEGILVREGTDIPKSVFSIGGQEVSPGEIQKEDIELLMELLSRAGHPFAKEYSDIVWLKILAEESGVYFEGQKSLEDVVDIIAGRLQLYLDEGD